MTEHLQSDSFTKKLFIATTPKFSFITSKMIVDCTTEKFIEDSKTIKTFSKMIFDVGYN